MTMAINWCRVDDSLYNPELLKCIVSTHHSFFIKSVELKNGSISRSEYLL